MTCVVDVCCTRVGATADCSGSERRLKFYGEKRADENIQSDIASFKVNGHKRRVSAGRYTLVICSVETTPQCTKSKLLP